MSSTESPPSTAYTRPLAESGRRVLDSFDRQAVQTPDRLRIILALESVTSTEWSRVMLALTSDQLDLLERPRLHYWPNEAHHVLRVASTIAEAYGHETVSSGHLAVALALTADEMWGANKNVPQLIAEAYGLGTLENVDKVTDQYLIQLEREEGGYSDSSPLDGVSTGIAEPQFTLRRIANVGQLLVRLAGSAVLFVLAAQSGYWPAWVIAVVSLLSTRDARDRDQIIAEPVGILEPKARWSSHALLVLACAALGLWSQAAVLVLVLFLAELLSVLGEWAQATGARFHGPAVARAGNEFRRIPTLGLRYLAWLRGQRWIWSAGVALIATFSLFSTLSTFWPILALLLYAIVRRRWFVAAASVVVVFFFTGASPRVALAFVVVVVIIAMIGLIVVLVSERQPRAPVPFAAVELRGGLRAAIRYFRAHRLLANDQPDAAANLLRRAPAPTPGEVALLAWSARSTGDPAGAKRWAAMLPDDWMLARLLIEADAAAMVGDLVAAELAIERWRQAAESRPVPPSMAPVILVTAGGLDSALGRGLPIARIMVAHLPTRVSPDNLVAVMGQLRVTSSALLEDHPVLASAISMMAMHIGAVTEPPEEQRDNAESVNRAVRLEFSRLALATYRAESRFRPVSPAEADQLLGPENGLAMMFFHLGRPIEASSALLELVDSFMKEPTMRRPAYELRLEALSILNAIRHRFHDPTDRLTWWRAFEPVLSSAMAHAASGRDWRTLAELVESARLQLTPDSGAEGPLDAPFVRVRGRSHLEATNWYSEGTPPPVYDLERMAAAVGGSGTWWWSTWTAGHQLYWSVVPPEGAVSGGAVRLDAGVRTTLADLRDSLPVPYEGESDEQYDDRVRYRSALWIPAGERPRRAEERRAAELDLSLRLGELIPQPLRDALIEASEPISLAIAPASTLATVPWASLVVPGSGGARLVELAELAIAPPSSLLARIMDRPDDAEDSLPLSLLVADPTDELTQAAALREVVPDGAVVLPSDGPLLSADQFRTALRGVPRDSTLAFAGHTGSVEGTAGLAFSGTGGRELVTARDLVDATVEHPMPRQVLMLACDSADLGSAVAGEWFTLGPAVLWAGAERALVTSFPIPDTTRLDRALISGVGGGELRGQLRREQLAMLSDWRSGDSSAAPVHWAGHVVIGAFGASSARLDAPPKTPYLLEASLAEALDTAGELAARRGSSTIGIDDLALTIESYGFEDDLLRPARRRLVRAFYIAAWLLTHGTKKASDDRARTLSPEVRAVIEATREVARRTRTWRVGTEHLAIAYFSSDAHRAAVSRAVFGWDPREPERARLLLESRMSGYQLTGRGKTPHLSDELLDEIYAVFDLTVPGEEPRRLGR